MREEIIKMAKAAGIAQHGLGFTCWEGQLERFFHMAQAAERESCAKVADEFDPQMKMSNYGQVIANRIRARSSK